MLKNVKLVPLIVTIDRWLPFMTGAAPVIYGVPTCIKGFKKLKVKRYLVGM